MGNLIELANEVQGLMQVFDDIGSQRERLRELNTRTKMIHDIRVMVDEAEFSRRKMLDAGIHVGAMPKASKVLIAKSHKVKVDFDKNWEKVISDKKLSPNFIDPAKQHFDKKVLKSLRDVWREYVNAEAPDISKNWLDRLPDSAFGNHKRTLFNLLEEINRLRSKLPTDILSVERVKSAAEEASKIFAELDSIPETVRTFLAKAARGDAQVTDLSDDVRKWLDEHEMLSQLRIRFG